MPVQFSSELNPTQMEKEDNLKAAATAAVSGENSSLAKTFKVVVHEEHEDGKDVTWKSFKDGLLLHRSGNTWAAAVAEGAAGRPRGGPLARTASARAPQKKLGAWNGGFGGRSDEQDEAVAALLHQRPQAEEQPVKMSLMALLADSGGYSDDDEDDYEGEEDGAGQGDDYDDGDEKEGDMAHECCVCMVRHKGAAFIPCGHTFCRLCSRELWVSRGNCPLCNGFILEILDIF